MVWKKRAPKPELHTWKPRASELEAEAEPCSWKKDLRSRSSVIFTTAPQPWLYVLSLALYYCSYMYFHNCAYQSCMYMSWGYKTWLLYNLFIISPDEGLLPREFKRRLVNNDVRICLSNNDLNIFPGLLCFKSTMERKLILQLGFM